MRFISEDAPRSPIDSLHREGLSLCSSVLAAVAYVHAEAPFLETCRDSGKPLKLWARYDSSPATNPDVLRGFLIHNSPNYQCNLVGDIFHAKVIWWRGFGAYIGSANLTSKAWFENIEAGIFLTEEEIHENNLFSQLEDFFDSVDERSHPLTREIVDEVDALFRAEHRSTFAHEQDFARNRLLPELKSLLTVRPRRSPHKGRDEFLREWNETVQHLRGIAERVSTDQNRPAWVPADTPSGIQADQFLHAYYYDQVREGNRYLYFEFHHRHKANPEAALASAMSWWASTPAAPTSEDVTLRDWAPYLIEHLDPGKLPGLTEDEFHGVCIRIMAARDHAKQVSWKQLGLQEQPPPMSRDERHRLFSNWLYGQSNERGEGAVEVVHHVLHGGADSEIPHRLFKATHDESWKVPHLGVSMLGELVGWAKPDYSPPRNGRSSKALTALGYDVKIHS
jgi:hypothetical protein